MIEIGVSIISAIATILAVIITSRRASEKQAADFQKDLAITNTKLEELTREVREHNGFARRLPVVEEQIKSLNHRVSDLEKGD